MQISLSGSATNNHTKKKTQWRFGGVVFMFRGRVLVVEKKEQQQRQPPHRERQNGASERRRLPLLLASFVSN